tara:strand:+ start:49 stop:1224 length:1176 start_codon:yes stop_codon:yes gene_type:complete
MELIHPIFKWLHVIAGIMWIGLLYFFNFVNTAFAPTMDGDTKKKVVPELMPRTLYWFRMGAAWTWGTGIVLLYVIYWAGGMMPSNFTSDPVTGESANMFIHILLLLTFVAVFLYDAIYKSPLASNTRAVTVLSFVLITAYVFAMQTLGGFEYRAVNIHLGAMFGTIMAFNVWFRIWPAQKKIIAAIKNGDAPDGQLLALAGLRSKHNTYMSVPLIWTMHNQHHVTAPTALGIPAEFSWLLPMAMVILGWHIVYQLYKKSANVPTSLSPASQNHFGLLTLSLILISFFLPWVNVGEMSFSLFDYARETEAIDLLGILLLSIGALMLFSNSDKNIIAVLSGIGILFPLHRLYQVYNVTVDLPDAFKPSFGIGGYLLIIAAGIQLYMSLNQKKG